jgi:dTDP-4-amino-4,6-dideoxygalactose transaminase
MALGVQPGDRVATTPLTMAATSIAILNVGATPVYCDVDPDTWLMRTDHEPSVAIKAWLPVSLYGLHVQWNGSLVVDDAAQTLRPHDPRNAFTSLSFQSSKILALGEGGMLATNDESLATAAREISSLGYRMRADQPRIDSRVIRDPAYARHYRYPALNARMNDMTAQRGLDLMPLADFALECRREAAALYAGAVAGCSWITPQHVPDDWTHSYWSYAVALKDASLWHPVADAIERHGGERPYSAWLPTYLEPAFQHLALRGTCPVAEALQPRIVAFQTNDLTSAARNAEAVVKAIREIGG